MTRDEHIAMVARAKAWLGRQFIDPVLSTFLHAILSAPFPSCDECVHELHVTLPRGTCEKCTILGSARVDEKSVDAVAKAVVAPAAEEAQSSVSSSPVAAVPLSPQAGRRGGPANVGGHFYPGCQDEANFYTSDCSHMCGCWMGRTRSGGPDGIDPFGDCPKNSMATGDGIEP